jgi:hypothetical protein
MSESTLPMIANKLHYDVLFLEEFKTKLPSVPTEDLVDGYVEVKDLGKRIDYITQLLRGELLTSRFFDDSVKPDEKGHRYLSGFNRELKAEKRVMKPKIDQEKAREFFEKKGLLHKVSDINVSLSTEDIQDLLVATSMIDTKPTILAKLLKVKVHSIDIEQASEILHRLVDKIHQKGVVTINEDKVSALVALEEITLDEIEHLFEYNETYALKEVKDK